MCIFERLECGQAYHDMQEFLKIYCDSLAEYLWHDLVRDDAVVEAEGKLE